MNIFYTFIQTKTKIMETIETQLPPDQKPLNFKEWALNIFLAGLPLIGLILLLVWAFNDSGNMHRKEWAKGMLLIYVIAIILSALVVFLFGGLALIGANME